MKRKLISIVLLVVMVMTAFFSFTPIGHATPSNNPQFTTGLASAAGYYMEVYSDGAWKDLKTPQHWDTATGDIAYCLNHPMDYPVGTQTYSSLDPTTTFSSTTMNGLYTILSHGYPNTTGGLPNDMARYATSNAVRAWLSESQGIGYNYMNVSNGLIRAKSGSPWAYDWMLGLLNLARAGNASYLDWSGHEVTTNPSKVVLTLQSGNLVSTCTVDSPSGTYIIDNSKLPSGVSISGFTGNDNDTLTITAPIDIGSGDITISDLLLGTSVMSTSNVHWFDTSGGYQPMVCVDFSKLRTVMSSDLTLSAIVGGYIQVIKRDDETSKYLQGAVFGIYKPDGTQIDTLVTNVNGTEKSVFLNSGEYYIQEKTSPTGYVSDDAKHFVSVAINRQTHVMWLTNTKIKGRVELLKVGETDNPLKDAVYGLFLSDNTFIEDLTTDDHGAATSSLIPFGHYYLKEKIPPANYNINTTKHEFNISVNNETVEVKASDTVCRGNIQIAKVDEKERPLQGVVFGIYDTFDTLLEQLTTNENGLAVSSDFVYGDYYIKEISTLPQYLLSSEKMLFSISQSDITIPIDIVNNFKHGYIEIFKTGDYEIGGTGQDIPLSGVEFKIRRKDDNSLAETITTDESGFATSDLPYGTYTVSESKTPLGYIGCQPFEVVIDTDGITHTFDIENTAIRANITIVKKDIDTGLTVAIAGTQFKIKDSVGNFISRNGSDTFTTDDTGSVSLSEPLYLGNYALHEVSPPYGYYIDETPMPFSVDEQSGGAIRLEHLNKIIEKQIRVTKSDSRDGTRKLAEAVFEIFNDKGETVDTITTIGDGAAVSKMLPYGDYTLKETIAPIGFELSGVTLNAVINEDKTEICDVEATNIPTEITIIKHGSDTDNPLANATVQVFESQDNLVYEVATDSGGSFTIMEIPVGSYTFKEKTAPTGYILNPATYTFEITEDGSQAKEIFFENDPTEVVLTKTDLVSGNLLEDAEIEVFNSDDESVYKGKTDEAGQITLTHLPIGTYSAIETKAPDGYILNSEIIELTIDEYGVVTGETQVENCPTQLNIFKVDYETGAPLTGAGFKVKNFLGLNVLSFTQDENGAYWIDKDGDITEVAVDENGEAVIHGLPFGNYWLEESVTPDGYYPTTPIKIEITEENDINMPYEAKIANSVYVKLGLDRDRYNVPIAIALAIIGVLVFMFIRKKRK